MHVSRIQLLVHLVHCLCMNRVLRRRARARKTAIVYVSFMRIILCCGYYCAHTLFHVPVGRSVAEDNFGWSRPCALRHRLGSGARYALEVGRSQSGNPQGCRPRASTVRSTICRWLTIQSPGPYRGERYRDSHLELGANEDTARIHRAHR